MKKLKPLIIANFKLNGNKKTLDLFLTSLINYINNIKYSEIAIAPPLIYLDFTNQKIMNSKISLTAQNVDIHLSGAFTGEISAEMLKDIGVKYVIIGHSERRYFHKENNTSILKKIEIIKKIGLIPIICFGETFEEKQEDKTNILLKSQIDLIVSNLGIEAFANTIIAYEPIWAIGTGKSAIPNEIQNIHKFIKNYLTQINSTIGNNIIIQYGGSITKENISNFISQPDINGLLIGKSSLDINLFISLLNIIEKTYMFK